MNECIIGVGSNIDPVNNIQRMLVILERETRLLQVSSWLKTAPIGITDQADFVNGAVKVQTLLNQVEFNIFLKQVEDTMGRDRTLPKYGPRIIDLDIVVWNGNIVDEDYYNRDFLRNAVDEILT
ncbi:MAG: 2-amino-4-hydroxy-6-hydroxymethyldihydropteridine diphosphokinase [Marinifilaceae bacterium]